MNTRIAIVLAALKSFIGLFLFICPTPISVVIALITVWVQLRIGGRKYVELVPSMSQSGDLMANTLWWGLMFWALGYFYFAGAFDTTTVKTVFEMTHV